MHGYRSWSERSWVGHYGNVSNPLEVIVKVLVRVRVRVRVRVLTALHLPELPGVPGHTTVVVFACAEVGPS